MPNHDEWSRVSCLLVSSGSRSDEALGPMQKLWQLVWEVSFADLRFAKTDFSGVDVGDSLL